MDDCAHHYIGSGLLHVYVSGISVEVDEDGDETVMIPAVNELHHVIATGIVSHPKGMSGEELRFLRSEVGLTQAELASLVHRDRQSVGRWERNEIEIDGTAEALIRRLAIEQLKLPLDPRIDELSRRSVPTAQEQPIRIRWQDNRVRPYELLAA